ncbi:phosphoinositide 3-kinase regulatory subunit 6 isoform X16 [Symphalangus syndactylus]|uniref:phosphoinositide 3-kinase regulatory subunit 6 isoform X16 n=1 Tax=Symphalangus syndactylus TaxID=9590 RepID=UPI003006176E
MLIFPGNSLTDTSRNNASPAIWASLGLVKMTHKMNHHKHAACMGRTTSVQKSNHLVLYSAARDNHILLLLHPKAPMESSGMWRWSLHKKVERDPGKSPALVRILLRELEKAESEDLRHVIIPLLHTVMYVLTKATGITEELYQRIYAFCTRLLTLPTPYCTVALDCAIRLKTETAVPGTLYQRMVIAEQNLMNELYPYQERVFLFVDPELVSASVCSALLLEIEAAQAQQTPEACMRHVVSHALQAALGEACHAGALHRKLQASPRRTLERYFHAVVAAVEQMASEASPSREGHVERLEEIYCSLLGPAAGRCGGDLVQERPPSIPLPSPYITFHLWTDEEQLWKELVLFLRPRSQLRLSADLEVLDLQGLRPDRELARVSVLSTDSGIERDLPPGADELPAPSSPEMERAGLQRKGGIKKRAWHLDFLMPDSWDGPPLHRRTGRPGGDGEMLPGVSRLHTARVLVLGDDRMLGRLAQAYHRLRKRETQKFCLTPRLSLQLYYIPVLAPEPPSLDTSRTVDPFILDVITYYVRMGTQPIYFQIYTVKIFFSDLSQDPTEDIFLIELKVKIQDSKFPKDSFSPRRRGVAEGAGAELSLCYQKALLSHRPREVTVSLRATGLVLKAIPASNTEDSDQHLQDEQYPDPEPGPEAADTVTGQGRSTHFQRCGQIRGCSLPRTVFRGPEVQGAVAQSAWATGDGSNQSQAQAPSDAHQHILWHCPVSLQGQPAQEEGYTTPPTPTTHTAALALTRSQRVPGSTGSLPWGL